MNAGRAASVRIDGDRPAHVAERGYPGHSSMTCFDQFDRHGHPGFAQLLRLGRRRGNGVGKRRAHQKRQSEPRRETQPGHGNGRPFSARIQSSRTVGPPRCVNHAWELRREIAAHVPGLSLGGWANPHADAARQLGYLVDGTFNGDYFLTQVVSHHHRTAIERFQTEYRQQRITLPGVFGVFYYRSANAKTLETLRHFLPVPVDELTREFSAGATPDEVCARTIRTLRECGVQHFYVSNLPVKSARKTLERVLALAEG